MLSHRGKGAKFPVLDLLIGTVDMSDHEERSGVDPVPPEVVNQKPASVDKLTLLVSVLALALSVWTFVIVQIDRQRAQIEGQPRLSFSYAPYGVEERYGFSIRNTGNQRARIPLIAYTFNSVPNDAMRAGDILNQLQLGVSGAYRLISAPTYVL